MSELVLPAAVAGQLAFHTRMAAAAAVARGDGEADTEAVLAWTSSALPEPHATTPQ